MKIEEVIANAAEVSEYSPAMDVNGTMVSITELLSEYKPIIPKDSKNVFIAAANKAKNSLFVRFKNGAEYVYTNVDEKLLDHIFTVDSIGTFLHRYVIGKDNIPYRRVTNYVKIAA